MLNVPEFILLLLGLAAASAALARAFPPCLLRPAARGVLYAVAGLLAVLAVYTVLMAWRARSPARGPAGDARLGAASAPRSPNP